MGVVGLGALRGASHAPRTALVDVQEWGGQVMLRELSGAQRTRVIEHVVDLNGVLGASVGSVTGADVRRAFEASAEIVKMTWVDAEGEPVVQTAEDYDLLLCQPYTVVLQLAAEALKLARLTPESVGEAKKNSSQTPTPVSGIT